jgi:AcrR family transcriptional regulator
MAVAYRRTAQVQTRLEALREHIVAAAAAQLAETGYAGCSIAAVAERAGVAPGTLYNHVSSKSELVADVFRTVAGGELAALRTAADIAGPAPDRLTAVIESYVRGAVKAPRLTYALLVEPVDPSIERLRLRFRSDFRDLLAVVIDTGVRAGELPGQEADVVAAALVGAATEALVDPLSGTDDADVSTELVRFALRAVGALSDRQESDD